MFEESPATYRIEDKMQYTMKEAEKIRRQLRLNQKAMSLLMGKNQHTWAGWVNSKDFLPREEVSRFVHVVESLRKLHEGKKLLAITDPEDASMNRYLNESVEVLDVLDMQLRSLKGNEVLKRSMLSLVEGIRSTLTDLV